MDGIGQVTSLEVARLVVGALGGAAVGLERQWSGHASGAAARFAGIRTFTMLGMLGALAGWLITESYATAAVVVLAGAAALVVAGYVAASRHDVDATTEVAALVVLVTGVTAGVGYLGLSSGIVAVTSLLLVEKSRLHGWVARIDDTSLRAALRFGVMAAVILPLLPVGPLDPYGWIRPRALWALVLFFSGLSFIGYLARLLVGPRQGYAIAGLLGGFVSSTHVSLTFSRLSRSQPDAAQGLATGVIAASTFVFLRVIAAVSVINIGLVEEVAWLLVWPLVTGAAVSLWGMRHQGAPQPAVGDSVENPLQLAAALQMAVLFQVVLIALPLVQQRLGGQGVVASAVLLGLTDVDALTVSLARGAATTVPASTAALAIGIGVLTNTLVKLALVVSIGAGRYRRQAAGGLLALALVSGMTLLVAR